MKTARSLNIALLLACIAGGAFYFFQYESPELIILLIVQSIAILFLIIALLSKKLVNQKIFGIIPYILFLTDIGYVAFLASESQYLGLITNLTAPTLLAVIGLVKLIRVKS
ncbi:MAG: hypothetical protein GQ574_26695 [Crocinitomix sp.]|nr:hypothetical protein [Crocinitomix sp.]